MGQRIKEDIINGENQAVGLHRFFKMVSSIGKRAGKMALGKAAASSSKKRVPRTR